VPSRKQRRRRQKERRHEYEVVYVDDEGNEVEPPPRVEEKRERGGGRLSRGAAKVGRGGREAQPPSWTRSGKRALLFLPLFFIVFSLVNKKASIESRVLASVGYSALFVPLTYFMDRAAHRAFVRRSGR
jgi:hypothetical protein